MADELLAVPISGMATRRKLMQAQTRHSLLRNPLSFSSRHARDAGRNQHQTRKLCIVEVYLLGKSIQPSDNKLRQSYSPTGVNLRWRACREVIGLSAQGPQINAQIAYRLRGCPLPGLLMRWPVTSPSEAMSS